MSPPSSATPRVLVRPPPLRYLLLAAVGIIALVQLFEIAAQVAQIFLLAFFSVLLATALDVPTSWLARRMPRWLALLLTLVALGALAAGFVAIAWPTLDEQAREVSRQAPQAIQRARSYWKSLPSSWADSAQEELGRLAQATVPVAFGAVSALASLILVLVLSIFLAYEPQAYLEGALRLLPRRHEEPARELAHRVARTLRGWVLGTLAAMAVTGTITAVGLWLLGIPGWLVLGAFAFVGEFVPYVGPIVSAVPAVAVGLTQSPSSALYVALLFLGIQQVEGNLLQPLLMRAAVRVKPAVLLVGQVVLAASVGFVGVLVATPFVATLQVAIEDLYIERYLHRRRA